MRLFPRLLLTQFLPLVIVVVAVALVFASTTRVTSILGELRASELTKLQREAALHRTGWAVDVAMRHAVQACRAEHAEREARARAVERHAADLRRALEEVPGADPNLRRVSHAYVTLAERMDANARCASLLDPGFEARRVVLDEDLTNAWVGRMAGLHDAVIAREAEAQREGVRGLVGGVVLVLVALAIAVVVSLAFARSVTLPLEQLTLTARRLGRGEFDAPVVASGGPAEVVGLCEELERMRERLAELDSLKQQFVASVSHEMRTPLSKLREALALLADGAAGELGPRQQRVVRIAREACERQIRTVTTMLDLSRLRAGSPLRMRASTSLDGAVRAAIDEERADASSAGVGVELTLEGSSDVRARLDDVLFERAVANLVRNAVSVSRRGQRVVVRRELVDSEGARFARVSVRDEGPGVPPELERTIFQPFVSQEVAGSPKKIGIGLGLALASEVARAHGGRLDIVRPEQGAEFRLWIPLAGHEEAERAEEEVRA